MSVIAISYRSMEAASSDANAVAKKLNTYADQLTSSVYKKLNNYGSCTDNISMAKETVSQKIETLKSKSIAYATYAKELSDLKKRCDSIDKSVKTMVSQLSADFKSNNGINTNKVRDSISYFCTSLVNKTSVGRWLNEQSDKKDSVQEYIEKCMEDWWDYEGGKQLVKGVTEGVLTMAIAICTMLKGLASLDIADMISGIIEFSNGVTDIINEARGYYETRNGEPAIGRRRSDESTLQDFLRRESDSQYYHNIASTIDGVSAVCGIVGFLTGGKKLLENGSKFLAEHNLNWKSLFTKSFWTTTVHAIGEGLTDIKCSIKTGTFLTDFGPRFKKVFTDFGSDFKKNFIKNFIKSDDTSAFAFAKVVKNVLGIGKSIVTNEDGIVKGGFTILLKKIVIPCTGVMSVSDDKGGKKNVTIKDFQSTIEGIIELKSNVKKIFTGYSAMTDNKKVVYRKLDGVVSLDNIFKITNSNGLFGMIHPINI